MAEYLEYPDGRIEAVADTDNNYEMDEVMGITGAVAVYWYWKWKSDSTPWHCRDVSGNSYSMEESEVPEQILLMHMLTE